MELLEALTIAYRTGHAWNPDHPECHHLTEADLANLGSNDPETIAILKSAADMGLYAYTFAGMGAYGRPPVNDGKLGPAMEGMLTAERCPVPDHVPPAGAKFAYDCKQTQIVVARMQDKGIAEAQGSGSYPGCHGVGDWHKAIVMVDDRKMPGHFRRNQQEIIGRIQRSFANVCGLLLVFVDMNRRDILTGEQIDGNINIDWAFVEDSNGWIGLAQVGSRESCTSLLWMRILAPYKGGSTDAQIITQQTTLGKHEAGHVLSLLHTRGGVMNSHLINGLPDDWALNDPSTPKLKSRYGPVPYPLNGHDPDPDPPTGDVEQQLAELRGRVDKLTAAVEENTNRDLVRDAVQRWILTKVQG